MTSSLIDSANTPPQMARPRLPKPRLLVHMMEADANSFAVLRLAMALTVLASHSGWFVSGRRDSDPVIYLTGFTSGEHAVQVFFLLSGLLVAHSIEKSRNVLDFVVARTLRIFPGLIVCVVLTAVVIGPLLSKLAIGAYVSDPALIAYVLKTSSLSTASAKLPGLFEALPLPGLVNGSLWTLKFEALCYATLAAFGAVGLMAHGRRGVATVVLALIIAVAAIALPSDTTRYSTLENVAYFAIPFSLGVIACVWRDRIPTGWMLPLALAIPAYLSLGTTVQHITTGLFLGTTAIWLATFRFGPLRAAANRCDLSYGVYIYAAPIQQAAIQLVPTITASGVTAIVVLPVFVLAWLSWTLVEKPAMGLRRALVAMVSGRRPVAIAPDRMHRAVR